MAKTDRKEMKSTDGIITDPRFSSVYNDPRFAKVRRKDKQVALDDRFKRILTDKEFARKATRDKVGRKITKNAAREEIERLYHFEGDEDAAKKADDAEVYVEGESGSKSSEDDDSDVPVKFDPARGEGVIDTSSEESSEESGSEDDDDEEVVEEEAKDLDEAQKRLDEVPTGDITRRLAAVNLDWDHVRAIDLMATFSSFVPIGGQIERISIYPSEFGKQRMEREEMEGPPKEIFGGKEKEKEPSASSISSKKKDDKKKKKTKEEDGDDKEEEEITAASLIKEDKGEEFDGAKLRKYQLERLRYFYAIVECDSKETANSIYTDCDGAEYEATANFFDLRFVPDDTTFDDKPRDEWTGAASNYKPNDFVTDALQHSKVKLTWDQDDQMRKQVVKEAFSRRDIEDMDLKAYLASSDSESDAEKAEELRRQYRDKLNLQYSGNAGGEKASKSKKPVGDMEVTFTSALSGDKENGDIFEKEETTIEKYQRKERERRKKRKEKLKAMKSGDGEDTEQSDEEMAEATTEDLGFDDPFFDDAPAKVDKKKEKKLKKEKKVAAEAASAAEREKLELIMKDDDGVASGEKLEHYNMRNILKAEKATKLKGKAARRSKNKLLAAEGLQDDFKMDVKDPRFNALFENPEYAIDPTNPKFKKTNAMSKLLEEKRKRTGSERQHDGNDDERKLKSKKRKVDSEAGERDLNTLVRSMKNKSKRVVR